MRARPADRRTGRRRRLPVRSRLLSARGRVRLLTRVPTVGSGGRRLPLLPVLLRRGLILVAHLELRRGPGTVVRLEIGLGVRAVLQGGLRLRGRLGLDGGLRPESRDEFGIELRPEIGFESALRLRLLKAGVAILPSLRGVLRRREIRVRVFGLGLGLEPGLRPGIDVLLGEVGEGAPARRRRFGRRGFRLRERRGHRLDLVEDLRPGRGDAGQVGGQVRLVVDGPVEVDVLQHGTPPVEGECGLGYQRADRRGPGRLVVTARVHGHLVIEGAQLPGNEFELRDGRSGVGVGARQCPAQPQQRLDEGTPGRVFPRSRRIGGHRCLIPPFGCRYPSRRCGSGHDWGTRRRFSARGRARGARPARAGAQPRRPLSRITHDGCVEYTFERAR